jgi:hypothetical protein
MLKFKIIVPFALSSLMIIFGATADNGDQAAAGDPPAAYT